MAKKKWATKDDTLDDSISIDIPVKPTAIVDAATHDLLNEEVAPKKLQTTDDNKKRKDKSAVKIERDSEVAENRKEHQIALNLFGDLKRKLLKFSKEIDVPANTIVSFILIKGFENLDVLHEEIMQYRIEFNTLKNQHTLDLEKYKKDRQGSPLEKTDK
jgi:hypothetical protein